MIVSRRLATAALLALAVAGAGRAEVKVEAPARVDRDRLCEVKLSGATPKAQCRWKVSGFDAAGKPLLPDSRRVGNDLLFVGPPGTYRVSVLVVDFDAKTLDEGEATVVIGEVVPPVPPVPPPPSDPLVLALRVAYQGDAGAEKAKHLASLASLYRQAGIIVDGDRLSTGGQLWQALAEARRALLPDDALVAVRTRVMEELTPALPSKADDPLTAEVRAKAKVVFARVAAALEEVAK